MTKTRVNYPDLNEQFVKDLIKILNRKPEWFDMGFWGEKINRTNGINLTAHDLKIRKRDCGTICCLAGTVGLLQGTAEWNYHPNWWLQPLPGRTWAGIAEEGLGIDYKTATRMIYRSNWPRPINLKSSGVSDADGVLILLNMLLKDQQLTTENLPSKIRELSSVL